MDSQEGITGIADKQWDEAELKKQRVRDEK